jgi:hypothetical protein
MLPQLFFVIWDCSTSDQVSIDFTISSPQVRSTPRRRVCLRVRMHVVVLCHFDCVRALCFV